MDAVSFDYHAAVQDFLQQLGMGNWSIVTILDKNIPGNGRTCGNSEYLEATIKFNPSRIRKEGRDPKAVVEHEVLHLALDPLTRFCRSLLKNYVHDERVRDQLDDELDLAEHNALETIHRGFNPKAKQWSGKGGVW